MMASCVKVSDMGILVQVAGEPVTCQGVLLSGTEFQQYQELITGQGESVDYSIASSIFSFFFVSTLGLWFLSKNIGIVLQAIRRF
jgi:hypothetical protein